MTRAYCVSERAARSMAMSLRAHGYDAEADEHRVDIHEPANEGVDMVVDAYREAGEIQSVTEFKNWR